jgi:very-short-patch-repair endonuclease
MRNSYLRGPYSISIEEWNDRYQQLGLQVKILKRNSDNTYLCRCIKGHEFNRVYLGNKTDCPICAKNYRFSNIHKKVYEWIKSKNLKVNANCRDVISPKEIDLYLPEQKLAIEIDGIYWHSTRFLNGEAKNRLIRRKLLEDKNLRLLRFWDFEINKWIPVRSYLKSVLGLNSNRVGARKCEVRSIDSATANKFLDKWHIQGATKSSIRLGLYFENKLVGVMTFRKPSISKSFDWELARFSIKGNWSVAGVLQNYSLLLLRSIKMNQ